MNPDWLLKHFKQINEAREAVLRLRGFYLEYYDRVVPVPQMPSGKLVSKKSQMASGKSQDALPEPLVHISQTPSAKLAAAFPLKKRPMEWGETAVQNKSGGR